jgi:3-methyladenine DNA glycosylase AlkD
MTPPPKKPTRKPKPRSTPPGGADEAVEARVGRALAWLKDHSSRANRDGMARYAIPADKALGVAVRDLKALGKELGRDHALALALWKTGWYEARMVTAYVADPGRLTAPQMERWCKDFDSWAICDHLCFNLFDRAAPAWSKVTAWSGRRNEFERRAGFALLWSLALHDRQAADARFLAGLALIERAAGDDRNFVKKAVNMALKAIGRRNPSLAAAAVATATRLAQASAPSARWIGKDALAQLSPRSRA